MDQKTFAELGLSPKVQAAIEATGYTTPTPIQAAAIPVAIEGRDVLGIAQTGTGKTASFTLPMIARLETGRARARMPRSLILAPTRELAAQVAESFERYGVNHKLNVALLIGGVSFNEQNKILDRGADVLIATPGRMLDHFQRGKLMLMGVEILVIDEADRMLDMGFIPDIEKICKLLPPRRQTLFFSATMPPEITRLVKTFLKDPARVEVAPPATTAKTITQQFRFCQEGDDWAKREILRELIKADDVRNAIIFCNRKRDVAILLKSLKKHGFNAGALHGDMDQKARMETLDGFRNGDITFLAASDVAARGLDIPNVSHIFNYDLPRDSDDYVHRIGRTGRAGKEGHASSLVTFDDVKVFRDIVKMNGEEAVWIGEAPSEEELTEGAGKRRRGGRGRPAARGGREDSRGSGRGRSRSRRSEGVTGEAAETSATTPPAETQEKPADVQPAPAADEPQQASPTSQPGEEANPERKTRSRRGGRRRGGAGRAKSGNAPASSEQTNQPVTPEGEAASTRGRRNRPTRSNETADRGHASGFADNIPEFLRKPIRRAKVTSE